MEKKIYDNNPKAYAKASFLRRAIGWLFLMVCLLIVAVVSTLGGIYVGLMHSADPLDLSAEALSSAQTTKIFDNAAQPNLLAELHGVENRETIPAEKIPQLMRDAVVAVEDERFYQHKGVDYWGVLRAMWTNVRKRKMVQGGSTITQQYIKNAFINNDTTMDRKLKEAAYAYQLERQWSKEKILSEYLNTVYFGEGAYGIEAAAQEYFGIHALDLRPDQAALLAGLLKAPSAYTPRKNPETAMGRRDLILKKMYEQQFITKSEWEVAISKPLELAEKSQDSKNGLPYWIEMVREQLIERYGVTTVLGGGLRVYLCVDLELQAMAEQAIDSILTEPNDPSAALVCIEVSTGRMLAMVGGKDFSQSQFNLATQGRRQPGSAFKTFVLATALSQGLSPDTKYDSSPLTIELPHSEWKVSSTDAGIINLRKATASSSNGVYARLIMDVGTENVAKTAYDMGIQTSLGEEPNPAIALGGLVTGVSPLEMAMAYATLATGGNRISSTGAFGGSGNSHSSDSDPNNINTNVNVASPLVIERVTNAQGNILDKSEVTFTSVLDKDIAIVMTSFLQDVLSKGGTGTAANIGRPAAGKTGTTSNYRDAWFVGYTPELVTAVWVGYPDVQKAMTDVHGIAVTGGSLPAQIWAAFMKQALADTPINDFPSLSNASLSVLEVCSESHQLATEYCPQTEKMSFFVDFAPHKECEFHIPKEIPVPNVVGLTEGEAEDKLTKAGFKVNTAVRETDEAPEGIVLEQNPAAKSPLLQGKTVTLIVAAQLDKMAVVPNLVGQDISDARDTLTSIGFKVKEKTVEDDSPAGTVIAQNIAAGKSLEVGKTLELTVSSGPNETIDPSTTTTLQDNPD